MRNHVNTDGIFVRDVRCDEGDIRTELSSLKSQHPDREYFFRASGYDPQNPIAVVGQIRYVEVDQPGADLSKMGIDVVR
jgi:hypothetical protein